MIWEKKVLTPPPPPYRLKLKQHFRSTIQVNEMIIDLIKYSLDGRLWWLTVKFDTLLIFTYEMVDYDVGSDEKPIQHPRMQDVVTLSSQFTMSNTLSTLNVKIASIFLV